MPRSRLARALRWGGALLAALVVAFVVAVQLRWDRRVEAPHPALRATVDTAAIARGRYLVYGPAHCASCHVALPDRARLAAGGEPPLAGGGPIRIPPGTWYMANLTPDSATGIGRRTDGELARAIRHNVRRDGVPLLPAMQFGGLADDDLVAILSFLRSQPPVRNAVPEREVNFLGRAVYAFLLKPPAARRDPPAVAPAGEDAARGAYVVNVVANCAGCHTRRSMVTGEYTGAPFAGGSEFKGESGARTTIVSPNITAVPGAGRLAGWTEAQFVARFRRGRAIAGSPMPWEAFARMSDADLRAVYRYLRTVGGDGE